MKSRLFTCFFLCCTVILLLIKGFILEGCEVLLMLILLICDTLCNKSTQKKIKYLFPFVVIILVIFNVVKVVIGR